MLQPNRHKDSKSYRYGFQGQEKDDEIKGEGNAVNYKYRMHDPRLGRFFATDPLEIQYPFYSPYSFSGNRLIDKVELEGLEPSDYDIQNDPFVVVRLVRTIMDGLEIASYNSATYLNAYGSIGVPPVGLRTIKESVQGEDGFWRVEKRIVAKSFSDATFGLLDVLGLAGTLYGGPQGLLTKPQGTSTQASETAKQSIKKVVGEYKKVKGHHVHAKAGFKNHAVYDPDKGFSISQKYMKENGLDHTEMTRKQRKLFDELAKSGKPNTLEEHTRIAKEALKAGGASDEMADDLIKQSVKNLKEQGVDSPSHIPWNKE
jgi:RHS repeat-associated protein